MIFKPQNFSGFNNYKCELTTQLLKAKSSKIQVLTIVKFNFMGNFLFDSFPAMSY
ncbi:hypothetical protein FDUTEX481_09775 [Tolypothrix sp. PCC 7601]|nr:hypothetical protein FDUTEX481_09775 [Tolypothrix sp. PCC 7601]